MPRDRRLFHLQLGEKQNNKKSPATDEVAVVSLLDRFSSYPSKGLTPQKLASLLREADGGDIMRQMELFSEILEKDAHAAALFDGWRRAVSRLNWKVIPFSDAKEHVEQAQAAEEMIKNIKRWRDALYDIADCAAKGFSLMEIFWKIDGGEWTVESLKWRDQKRCRFGKISDVNADPEELRLVFDPIHVEHLRGLIPDAEVTAATTDGISLDVDPRIRNRFIVTYFKAQSGLPSRTAMLRPLTYLYLFKNYDVKWWVQFAEVQLGYRVGKYDPAQSDQKDLLAKAIQGLATDAAAVISKDSEIEWKSMLEKAATHQIYKELKDFCNEEMTKLVWGHIGAIEGTPGKLGQEDLAKMIRFDRIQALAEVVDESVSDQLIRPFIEYNFGPQDGYPYYKSDAEPPEDLNVTAELVSKIQGMGYPVSKKWTQEKFGIPQPNPDDPNDEALTPAPPANPFLAAMTDGKKKLLMKR